MFRGAAHEPRFFEGNEIDRFKLVIEVIERTPGLAARAADVKAAKHAKGPNIAPTSPKTARTCRM